MVNLYNSAGFISTSITGGYILLNVVQIALFPHLQSGWRGQLCMTTFSLLWGSVTTFWPLDLLRPYLMHAKMLTNFKRGEAIFPKHVKLGSNFLMILAQAYVMTVFLHVTQEMWYYIVIAKELKVKMPKKYVFPFIIISIFYGDLRHNKIGLAFL